MKTNGSLSYTFTLSNLLKVAFLLVILQSFPICGIGGDRNLEKLIQSMQSEWDAVYAEALKKEKGEESLLSNAEMRYVLGNAAFNKYDFKTAKLEYSLGVLAAEQELDSSLISFLNYRLAVVNHQEGRFHKADSLFQLAYEVAAKADKRLAQVFALNGWGLNSSEIGNAREALDHFNKGIPIADSLGRKDLKWKLLYGKMEGFAHLGMYSAGYESGLSSLELAEELKDTMLIAKSNLGIAIILNSSKQHERSLLFYKAAYDAFYERGDDYWCGVVSINLCNTYTDVNKLELALEAGKRAERIFDTISLLPQVITANSNLGYVYSRMAKYDSALYYYSKNDELAGDRNISSMLVSYLGTSECYNKINRYEKSVFYAEKGLKMFNDKEEESIKLGYYAVLADSYEKLGNLSKAYEYQKLRYNSLKEGRDVQETKKITELEARFKYEREKADLESKQLLEKAKSEKELANREDLIKLGTLIILLISILLFLIYRLYSNKQKDNRLLQASNEEVKKQAAQLKEMDSIKSRFFTNISHEFRTPLTLIRGPIDQMSKENRSEEEASLLKTAKKNTDRLLVLVNQILELSELQVKGKKLKLQEVDLESYLKRIVGSFESLAKMRNIHLSLNLPDAGKQVYLEAEAIEKVLVNLLSNAFKFTGDNKSIHVSGVVENGLFILKVSDTGVGIEKSKLQHIFEMFYYTDSDRSVSSGIGLALINELVRNHKGTIEVESAVKEGTTFTVEVPVSLNFYDSNNVLYEVVPVHENKKIEPGLDVGDENETTTTELKTDKYSVLLIEDNEDIRTYVKSILISDYNILEASNGKDGVEKALEFIPDLILSDVMMPVMDGFEAAKILKTDEKTSHIPLILLTAKGDKQSKLDGLSIQIDDYLLKPFDHDELLIRIRNLIENRKVMQEKFGDGIRNNPEKINLPSLDQQFVDKVRKVIEERMDDPDLSVDELAKEVGVSRSQLHRKMVALSGRSTSVFIRNIRLRKAHLLLENNVASITEICYLVGFSSPSYFNKCFKEMYGVTPKQVRLNS